MKISRTETREIEPEEIRAGDVLEFGAERWKVLEVEGGKALVWKCGGVRDHVFNENGENKYEGSDIQKYLREEFSAPEFITSRGEGFFLLSEEEVRHYMPHELDRIATDQNAETTWWWTRSPFVGSGSYVRNVDPSGGVSGNYASDANGTAPACRIHLSSSIRADRREDKQAICNALAKALQLTREFYDLASLEYRNEDGDESVRFVYLGSSGSPIDVTADSGVAMIRDIMRWTEGGR